MRRNTFKAWLAAQTRETVVFGCVGVTSTLTYLGISMLCSKYAGIGATLSSVIGHTVATCVSYLGHHTLTFRKKGNHVHYGQRFVILMIVNYLLNIAIIQGTTRLLSWPAAWGFYAVAVIVPGISYLISKFWVFAVDKKKNMIADSNPAIPTND